MTDKLDLEQMLTSLIREEFMENDTETVLNGDLQLVQEGVIDSLGIFRLIGLLEQKLGLKVDPEDLVIENFETINSLKAFVGGKLS